ncbi:hypothetical protein BC343_29600 [Mucilaginibacter pedocola]|uniref:Uncharacterized protein n=2 Tax=Mucilaginibacter pedocola TaxID=1792845 RepID=A0A1S9PDP0_9SPHI|nr:hypothetical protein BC343_29600 [Mucilaginibacter pedocola]
MFFCARSFAQNADSESSARQSQVDNIVANYYTSIGDQSRLYNGPEYSFYPKMIKGIPYFTDTPGFTNGDVEYDGFKYSNLQMMYDLYKGSVVMQLPSKAASIELISDRVQAFDIYGHHFFRMDELNQTNGQNLAAGFYDRMYAGKTEFIISRRKTLETSNTASLEKYFADESDKMYLKVNGLYKGFGSKNALIDILADKKAELKKFIKDNRLNFSEEKEQSVVKVIAYYDQITN